MLGGLEEEPASPSVRLQVWLVVVARSGKSLVYGSLCDSMKCFQLNQLGQYKPPRVLARLCFLNLLGITSCD